MLAGRKAYWFKLAFLMMMCVILLGLAAPSWSSAEEAETSTSSGSVYVIPVKISVQSGLASFLDRALTEAEEARASLVVLEIDTPGGQLDTAEEIALRIREAKVPTVAYVSGKAASAGAYLALNAEAIAMAPGSTIGAAQIVDGAGNAVDNPKLVSFWKEEMASAAQMNGRSREIAAAMVDPNEVVELKELGRTKMKGQILSLSTDDALKVGFSDFTAASIDEVLEWKGLAGRTVVEMDLTLAEKISQAVTSPGMATLLLIIGIAGVAIELLVPGFGIPGITGLIAFALYFFGQSIAGFAGMESIIAFVLGIILLVLEMFVPSFGILGLLGSAGLIYGIASSAYDQGNAVQSLAIAFLVALVIVAVIAYVFRRRGIWNRFILKDQLTSEQGYVPNVPRDSLIGAEGVALSTLRPAGVAEIGGERMDVVTAGDFIEPGKPVRVTLVDGTRIVVKEIKDSESKS